MKELPANWQKDASEKQGRYKRFLQKADVRKAMKHLPGLHDAAFEQVDCLTCAACCKNYSPRFKTPDIKRISKALKLKESVFIDTYLNLDAEGDFVVKQSPCPFLGADNACSIYAVRPSDCERFPYTNEDVVLRRPALTLKNVSFCPIAYLVVNELEKRMG